MSTESNRHDTALAQNKMGDGAGASQPPVGRQGPEVQPFGTLAPRSIGLDESARRAVVEALNQVLADTLALRDLYQKHHWQVSGPTFYQLHLLFEKHYREQAELADQLAERVQTLGGVSVAMAHDVAEMAQVSRPSRGREDVPTQLARLLEAHEIIIRAARQVAREAAGHGDDGTNDLLVSDVVRRNEKQAWFVSEHLMDVPLVRPEGVA